MTIETQATTLFGGLAKTQTLKAIESGCSITSGSASVLITRLQANPIQAENSTERALFWRVTHSRFEQVDKPIRFSSDEYPDSFLWQFNSIKNLMFYFIATWGSNGKLSQERLCKAISSTPLSNSLISSISANLNSGVNEGLYEKNGRGKSATYSLAPGFRHSKQIRFIRFIPSPNAIDRVKTRMRSNSKLRAS